MQKNVKITQQGKFMKLSNDFCKINWYWLTYCIYSLFKLINDSNKNDINSII